jgi:hypothetical protein
MSDTPETATDHKTLLSGTAIDAISYLSSRLGEAAVSDMGTIRVMAWSGESHEWDARKKELTHEHAYVVWLNFAEDGSVALAVVSEDMVDQEEMYQIIGWLSSHDIPWTHYHDILPKVLTDVAGPRAANAQAAMKHYESKAKVAAENGECKRKPH